MSDQEQDREKSLIAAKEWIRGPVLTVVEEFLNGERKKESEQLLLDAFLNKGEDVVDGKFVVPGDSGDFLSRIQGLLFENEECKRRKSDIDTAIGGVWGGKGRSKALDSVLNIVGPAMIDVDGGGKLPEGKNYGVVKVEDKDLEGLEEAVREWLSYIWSYRGVGESGLLKTYLESISFEKTEIKGVRPPITFDKLATELLMKIVEMKIPLGLSVQIATEVGASNLYKSSEDMKELIDDNVGVVRETVRKKILDTMTDWQIVGIEKFHAEVEELPKLDEEAYKRMEKARSFYSLVTRYKNHSEPDVLEKIKGLLNRVQNKNDVRRTEN